MNVNPAGPPSQRSLLPDRLCPGIRILFVGINPGMRSAAVGHHFAGPSNRFWKLLFESGLVSERLTYEEDWRLPEWGLGLTNIIARSTVGIDELRPEEYRAGVVALKSKIRYCRPSFVAFLGVTIYRMLFAGFGEKGLDDLGSTKARLGGAHVVVLPNPSGRNAHYSYDQMLRLFILLRKDAHRSRRPPPQIKIRLREQVL
jgi:TDG/mug DNA glycosylase family protein